MSELVCARCGDSTPLFGAGGGRQLAAELEVPLLGQVPLDMALRQAGDDGVPVVVGDPTSVSAVALKAIASAVQPVRRPLVRLPLGLEPV